MVNMRDSKSRAVRFVGSSPTSGTKMQKHKIVLAYLVGVALGDGNLSNPNGRAVRLRVTCDVKYPQIIKRIMRSIRVILPKNKVSPVLREKQNCVDVSCYSNQWEKLLGWRADGGTKEIQKVSVPSWIKKSKIYCYPCLKGLIETDGSVYVDRGYKMVNFTNIVPTLVKDVEEMIQKIGFLSHTQKSIQRNGKIKYVVRISKNSDAFLKKLKIEKQ